MNLRGFTEAAISTRLGVKRATFNHWLNDRTEPKFETLLEFCEIVGIDVSDVIRRDDDAPASQRLEPIDDDFVKIGVLDIGIGEREASLDQLAFRSAWLNRKGIHPAHASLLRIEDDKMEPTLSKGGVAMIDRRDTTPTLKSQIYAVEEGDLIQLRRVERSENGEILMLGADNPGVPTKAFAKEHKDGIKIIGRLVWSSRSWAA